MKTKIQHLLIALTLLACLPHAEAVISATDTQITYQGLIANQLDHGSNRQDFAVSGADLTFTLFDTNSGGSPISVTITNTAVVVNSNGLFTTTMDFGSDVFSGAASGQWLEIAVRTNGGSVFTTLTPRQRITSAPFAQTAGTALSVSPTTIVQGQSLSIGVSNLLGGTLSTVAGGSYNAATVDYAVVAGGYGNIASSNSAAVGGGSGNVASGDHAVVAGGEMNTASGTHAFVGGGYYNLAGSDYDVCVGGVSNIVSGDPAFLGGGIGNWVYGLASWGGCGEYNKVFSSYSGIGGGYNNTIQTNAVVSFIGGGIQNSIQSRASWSFIGGGGLNTIQSNSTLSVISGGDLNTIQANGSECVISGGTSNTIQSYNIDSTIAGGFQNTIASTSGVTNGIATNSVANVIGGGTGNLITNTSYATIPGGQQAVAVNYAQLAYSGGAFTNAGDSQYSLYVLRGITGTNYATPYLYLDGQSLEISLPGNRACAFTARVIGRAAGSGGDCCAFTLEGVANNSSIMAIPPQIMNSIYGGLFPPSPTISNGSDGKLHIQVTGDGINTIRWTATIETTEVSF